MSCDYELLTCTKKILSNMISSKQCTMSRAGVTIKLSIFEIGTSN